jgi:hypothetical protein
MTRGWSSDWYADRFSGDDQFSGNGRGNSPCMHRHVVAVTTGGRRFSQGEVNDNIRVRLQCLDCLEYVSEAEVRGAWQGRSDDYPTGGDDDNF